MLRFTNDQFRLGGADMPTLQFVTEPMVFLENGIQQMQTPEIDFGQSVHRYYLPRPIPPIIGTAGTSSTS